tara:strand:- start:92071 stop:92706 length:636 start_codon:yes stop_codon:yes gene_type:complete
MKNLILILFLVVLSGCASTKMIDTYKNPDHVVFTAYKVLLVGITPNEETRVAFETKLKNEFEKRNIEVMRSVDLFDVEFTVTAKTMDELDAVEQQLIEKDFDAVLITKVTGTENKQTFKQSMADWASYKGTFRDDYMQSQNVYYDTDYFDAFKVYHTETSLYCICEGKDRFLVWRGSIDITDPKNVEQSMNDYVKLVVNSMESQDVIFRKK